MLCCVNFALLIKMNVYSTAKSLGYPHTSGKCFVSGDGEVGHSRSRL